MKKAVTVTVEIEVFKKVRELGIGNLSNFVEQALIKWIRENEREN